MKLLVIGSGGREHALVWKLEQSPQIRELAPLLLQLWNGRRLKAMKTFAQVLDSADALAIEEQESLIQVLERRLAERRRAALVEAVKSARREFREGGCRPATPRQILKRILA